MPKYNKKEKSKGPLVLLIGCAISLVIFISAFAFDIGPNDYGIWGADPEENIDQSTMVEDQYEPLNMGVDAVRKSSLISREKNKINKLLEDLSELCDTEDIWPNPMHRTPLERHIIEKGEAAVPQLIEALEDESENANYRAFAAQMLGEIDDSTAEEALRDNETDEVIGYAAGRALRNSRFSSSINTYDVNIGALPMANVAISPQGERANQSNVDMCLNGN